MKKIESMASTKGKLVVEKKIFKKPSIHISAPKSVNQSAFQTPKQTVRIRRDNFYDNLFQKVKG